MEKKLKKEPWIIIKPLSKNNLNGALKVLDKVFGKNPNDRKTYYNAFLGSLDMDKYIPLKDKAKPTYLQYFVAWEKTRKIVVGTTGLYAYREFGTEKFGLGWYCVDPDFRGKGIGSLLLDFTIQLARQKKRKFLELWTLTDPQEEKAHRIYEKRGFKITKKEKLPEEKYETVYMELKL